ncbi:unnamed protein product [Strongylus vulgaris]|uniref:Uncharacterized protein n=1 Tax=Strongylus vulgaris TaxID=40348 RepID=A0A3P7IWX3_STRVU|nr:unnamed protein product [Strongylus vulgaris]
MAYLFVLQPQHCFHPFFLSLAYPPSTMLNCGGEVRKAPLPAENLAGPSVRRARRLMWLLAFRENVLLREVRPEFLVYCRLSFSLSDQATDVLL